jgi:hypothetical protein
VFRQNAPLRAPRRPVGFTTPAATRTTGSDAGRTNTPRRHAYAATGSRRPCGTPRHAHAGRTGHHGLNKRQRRYHAGSALNYSPMEMVLCCNLNQFGRGRRFGRNHECCYSLPGCAFTAESNYHCAAVQEPQIVRIAINHRVTVPSLG